MIPIRSLPRAFQLMEWMYMATHFGMSSYSPGYNLPAVLAIYSIFFLMGWLYPIERPYWQRLVYVFLGLTISVWAKQVGIGLDLFLFFYIAKGSFLLSYHMSVCITVLVGIVWTVVEYFAEIDCLKSAMVVTECSRFNPYDPLRSFIFNLSAYATSSVFLLMFVSMLKSEQKSREQVEVLSEQVETLVATLERNRIAREIHDSLGHTLTDLDTQLALAQLLRSRDLPKSFAAIDLAKLLARQCIEDVSQALERMRQSDFDLNQALIGLVELFRQSAGIEVKWQIDLPQLSVYQSYQVYCIIKEALMNVQKHARATQVSFSGRVTSAGISLFIQDNGMGFNPEKFQTGLGIQGMMERSQLLGGRMDIKTAPAQGTQIKILLPL
jgi:signal transduction histidine kinase